MPTPSADRVVGVGKAALDILGVVPRSRETSVELAQLSIQGGGPTANMLATLAVLGAQPVFVGRVSGDEMGQFILRSLRDIGVDVSWALVEAGGVSPVSLISVDEQTRRRQIHFTSGSLSPLLPAHLPAQALNGARLVCLDGQMPGIQVEAAERARAKEIPVILDASHLAPGIGELLALCDVVIGSERFAAEIAPAGEIEDSLVEIAKMGPRLVVVTMGEMGAVGLEGDKLVRQNALPVEIVDVTGAGDVFHGAFAYGVLHGWTLEKCMPFASAAAGLKCRSLGARAGLPTLAEVMRAVEL